MKYQDLSQFRVPKGFRGKSAAFVQLWWLVQAFLFKPSPQFAYQWRVMLLRLFGAKIGKNVIIRPSVRVTYPWKIKIGDNVWVGDRAELYSLHNIEIGANTCISQDSYLCTGSHDFEMLNFAYNGGPIAIGHEVWLAAGTFVGPSVTVGDATVVGARSLVLKSLQEDRVYAGNPAKFLRMRQRIRVNT